MAARLRDWPGAERRHPGQYRIHRNPGPGGHRRPAGRVPGGRAGRGRRPGGAVGPAGAGHPSLRRRGDSGDRGAGPPTRPVRRGAAPRLGVRPDPAAAHRGGPGRGYRGGRAGLRRGPQRDHRVGRLVGDARGPGGGQRAGAGQQGVAGGRRSAGDRRRPGRPIGGRRLRALRIGAVPTWWQRGRGRPADPDGQRWSVPRLDPGADGGRHPGAGPGPSHLGHGSGDHHQLGHPGQQGSGTAGSAPALRRGARPDRRGRAPAVDGALDGAVRGRRHPGPVFAAGHEATHRARPQLARPAGPGISALRLERGVELDVRAAGQRGVPGGRTRPECRSLGRERSGGVQRGQRGLCRRVPRPRHPLPRHPRHRGGRAGRAHLGSRAGYRRRRILTVGRECRSRPRAADGSRSLGPADGPGSWRRAWWRKGRAWTSWSISSGRCCSSPW